MTTRHDADNSAIIMGVPESTEETDAMTTMTKQTTCDELGIGDGATECRWTDRKAGTVIAKTATTITIQLDKAKLMNGVTSGEEDALTFDAGGFCGHTSGTQRYEYERDENGAIVKFTKRANGGYYRVGSNGKGRAGRLIVGRSEHYDYNF